mgnify:FL=1|tara:strand:- start:412 stop:1455 length:1044 start_codon:yes stop_codon:yes gene_type:complete
MVPFAGYAMPVQYKAGILKEHLHCRQAAALFDVSHMGQVKLAGRDADRALEALAPIDLSTLEAGSQRYSFFTNDLGGIRDDIMVTRAADHLYLVLNAGCKEDDFAHLSAHLNGQAELAWWDERALLALQGPAAAAVLARLLPGVEKMAFMSSAELDSDGMRLRVSRSGYSGEDGYEISVASADAEAFARKLLAEDEVAPVGLGARDSLRLEAGLCLYGHDIDPTTTPVEAGLVWAMGKRRRREGGFPGAKIIQKELAEGAARKRIGFKPEGRAPVREGAELTDGQGRVIGKVTSGGFGPSFGGPVAMGYVETAFKDPGTAVAALVRGRALPGAVVKLPFVKQNYYRG